ncbi:DNA/RNA non-specific endonuclease [Limosilactobacillus portuensis]|uniref:DNA/RNA non-specific endonuclease n=1 Tax=Limosilactobacillus portuensis TaxID=2742601 RepID=UPI0023582A71|nr:DNA/RNA non-specific endonuclease [Limosilactobacillus portuensis]WCT61638.1 DNA/RNA non-specific endonuclease [Limosilactobacillus portuensis]
MRLIKAIKIGLLFIIGFGIGIGFAYGYPYYQKLQFQHHFQQNYDHRSSNTVGGITSHQKQMLAQLNYHSGQYPIIYLNNGKSTLNPKSWKTNHVNYQQLDAQQRTSASNTAFLQQRNHANTSLRVQQTVEPAGWHPNRNGLLIYNRGHLIAYSLTAGLNKITGKYQPSAVGDQDNPRNLFTETDFTNQMLQTIYETEVRHAIEHGKHVIFQATPIFRNNETIARGINLQALSTDGTLNFNVYLFNVEPGIRINYQDGTTMVDNSQQIPVPFAADDDYEIDKSNEADGPIKATGKYSRPITDRPRQYYRSY